VEVRRERILSNDKSGGRGFDESDEAHIQELAALIGVTLDTIRPAAR
jgi:hypothetical protein